MIQIAQCLEQLPKREISTPTGNTSAVDVVFKFGTHKIVGGCFGVLADRIALQPLLVGGYYYVEFRLDVSDTTKDGKRNLFQRVKITEITLMGQ